jgi:hypothetical protein
MKNFIKLSILAFVLTLVTVKVNAQTVPDANTTVLCAGSSVIFTSSVDGSSYQWYKNGALISGSIQKTYQVTAPGDYVVVAISEHGCASDASDAIHVLAVPRANPSIQIVNNSSCYSTSNNVILNGSGIPANLPNGLTFVYNWRKVGSPTIISTDPSITLNEVSTSGKYTLTLVPVWKSKELSCSVQSSESEVIINQFPAKPVIAVKIDNFLSDDERNAGVVCERNEVTLTASVSSSDPNITTSVSYQWYKDGTIINGATTSILVLSNVKTSDSGNYTVKATTVQGCAETSEITPVDVKVRPIQPVITFID